MKKILSVLLIAMMGAVGATAGGTTAGTDIANYGTLSFQVAGVDQDEQNSTTDTFKVDRKIDVIVVGQDSDKNVTASPADDGKYLTFKVTNQGNAAQDFDLSVLDTNESGDDTISATNMVIHVDDGSNGYDAADTATHIYNLAPDAEIFVYITAKIPNDAVDGDVAEESLSAIAHEVGADADNIGAIVTDNAGAADRKNTMDTVFADADGDSANNPGNNSGNNDAQYDGQHIGYERFIIKAAVLSFEKWSIVVSDGISAAGEQKRIPGALIRYCFELNNTGTTTADHLSWTDAVPAELNITKARYADQVDLIDCDCNGGELGTTDKSGNNIRFPAVADGNITIDSAKTVCAFIEALIL